MAEKLLTLILRKLHQWVDRANLVYVRMAVDALYFRPLVWKRCRCQVYHRERLPTKGPTLLVCTHESHMDVGVIQALFPLSQLPKIRPSGARDYFTKGLLWHLFARGFMRLLFVDRDAGHLAKTGELDPFSELHAPLQAGVMVIVFPQGTRDPNASFRPGVVLLSRAHREVPIIPILLRGTREVLLPNTFGFRPGPISVYVGKRYTFSDALSATENVQTLQRYINSLDQ